MRARWSLLLSAAGLLYAGATYAQTCDPGGYAWVPLSAGAGCPSPGVCEIVPIQAGPPFGICEDEIIEVGESPEGAVLSPDGCNLYVANEQSCNVSVIDTVAFAEVGNEGDRPCVGRCPATIDVNAAGTLLFTADALDDSVSRIVTDDLDDVTSIDLSNCIAAAAEWPEAIAVSPNTGAIFVTLREANRVAKITSPTSFICSTVGNRLTAPRGMAVRPGVAAPGQVWITNSGDDVITIVNQNLGFLWDVDVGPDGPRGVAFSSDGDWAYVGVMNQQGPTHRFVVIDATQSPPTVEGSYDFNAVTECGGPRGVSAHPNPNVGRVFVTCGMSDTVVVMDVSDEMNPVVDDTVEPGVNTAPYAAGPLWVGGPAMGGKNCPEQLGQPWRLAGVSRVSDPLLSVPMTHCDPECDLPAQQFPCSPTNEAD